MGCLLAKLIVAENNLRVSDSIEQRHWGTHNFVARAKKKNTDSIVNDGLLKRGPLLEHADLSRQDLLASDVRIVAVHKLHTGTNQADDTGDSSRSWRMHECDFFMAERHCGYWTCQQDWSMG